MRFNKVTLSLRFSGDRPQGVSQQKECKQAGDTGKQKQQAQQRRVYFSGQVFLGWPLNKPQNKPISTSA